MKTLRHLLHKHIKLESLSNEEGIVSENQELDILDLIASGGFGKVYKGTYCLHSKLSKDKVLDVAVKEVKDDSVYRELRSLMELRQEKGIIHLYNFYERGSRKLLITELCRGGDMIDYMKAHGKFSEAAAMPIIEWLLEAVKKCHDHGICHNDIKLDNIGILNEGDLSELRLLDFGHSKLISEGPYSARDLYGSPHYLAPELFIEKYRKFSGDDLLKIDAWCVGVVAYCLVEGIYPYSDAAKIKKAPIVRRGKNGVSDACADLIESLLNILPEKRASVDQALVKLRAQRAD